MGEDGPLSDANKTGRVRVAHNGSTYTADWRVVGPRVELTSELGEASVVLGALASAPAAAAQEKLREMARQAGKPAKPAKPRTDYARFNVRDA